jgi:hypothetical protein
MDWKDIADRISTRGDVATVLICGTAGFVVDAVLLPMGMPPGTVATLAAAGGLGVKNAVQAGFAATRGKRDARREAQDERAARREAQIAREYSMKERAKTAKERAETALTLLQKSSPQAASNAPRFGREIDRLKKELELFDLELTTDIKLQEVTDDCLRVYRDGPTRAQTGYPQGRVLDLDCS